MKKTTKPIDEVRMIPTAIMCLLLVVIGHFVLVKDLAYFAWAEVTAAAIPFLLVGLGFFSVRRAAVIDQKNQTSD
ncbi:MULTISPECIES: hypothetical protein [unclassified Photobacterium]|uniref:hypothetical protein n=1 Tax=unclassified Photobacterium TaxID=2628852 RepID=UPI001B8AAE50|nr:MULTISPECIES: hypothetical protein [unclassified Photobacterium]MDO6708172.1 hypothetical protein [Photobacterium sp. 1_MG-2023]QUJ70192.1 hypothetical protein KDD30_18865 [Photobacterium sp. GJ3]